MFQSYNIGAKSPELPESRAFLHFHRSWVEASHRHAFLSTLTIMLMVFQTLGPAAQYAPFSLLISASPIISSSPLVAQFSPNPWNDPSPTFMAKVQTVYAKPRLFANACLPFCICALSIPGGSSNRKEFINWRMALIFVEDHIAISHL